MAQLRSAPLPLAPAEGSALAARVWSSAACLVSGDPLPPVRMPRSGCMPNGALKAAQVSIATCKRREYQQL